LGWSLPRADTSQASRSQKRDWLLRLLLGLIIIAIVGLVPDLGGWFACL
jgi:hypothetical protein